jgi:hypothetical protein
MKALIRKTILLSAIVGFLVVNNSCRKGEDDPSVTLLTRKARVAGKWKLQQGKLTLGIKDSAQHAASYNFTFDDHSYKLSKVYNGANFDGPSELSLSFSKTGKFSFKQTIDNDTFDASGTWDFQGKGGGYKNKERMTIKLDNVNGYLEDYAKFNKASANFSYRIKQLRNKLMVLEVDKELVYLDETSFGYYITAEYTFVQ